MSVVDSLNRRAALSFEVFPPRTDVGMEELCGEGGVLDRLYGLNPDAISCTCGTGGSDAGKSLTVLCKVARDGKAAGITHITCAGNTGEDIREQLQTYRNHGVCHMLALPGDHPFDRNGNGDLHSAAELIGFVRQTFGDSFTIAVSAPVEGYSRPLEADITSLKQAQDNGADYIITQPCWDLDSFRCWLDAIRAAGIRMPVEVSILPVLDQAQTISAVFSGGGNVMPKALCELISENWIYPNPFVKDPFDADVERKRADFRKAGIDYTIRQIQQYRGCGADGIHLITQNRFADVALIVRESGLMDRF